MRLLQNLVQRRSAFQTPEHVPIEPVPRQLPLPLSRDSRPEPLAPCRPAQTRTLTAPFGLTRPATLTAALPS